MLELKKLLESLYNIKEDKLPKFKSHIANGLLNEHELNAYAVLHTSFVLYAGSLSDKQQRLYQFYLPALSAQLKTADVLQQAQQLNQEQVTQSIKLLEEKELIHHFLVDVLVFARLNGDLSNELKQVLSAFCHGQSLTHEDVDELIYITDCILGVDEKIKPKFLKKIHELIKNEIWLDFIFQKLTKEKINVIKSGCWFIEGDNIINEDEFSWSNAVISFKKNASLICKDVKITAINCELISPIMTLNNCEIELEKINSSGNYNQERNDTSFTLIGGNLSVKDSLFTTKGARTFNASSNNINFIDCVFASCGHEGLNGGAVSHSGNAYFEHCHFIDCIGNVGAAIFSESSLIENAIVSCKFDKCLSAKEWKLKNQSNRINAGAIYYQYVYSENCIIDSQFDTNITIQKLSQRERNSGCITNSLLKGYVCYSENDTYETSSSWAQPAYFVFCKLSVSLNKYDSRHSNTKTVDIDKSSF